MNKYLEVAVIEKMVDNNIGSEEKFNIDELKYNPHTLHDTDKGLSITNDARELLSVYSLADMLESEIYKLPFPDRIKVGDKYYFVTLFNEIEETTYKATPCDGNLIETNNCFETREEAKKHKLVAVKKEVGNEE